MYHFLSLYLFLEVHFCLAELKLGNHSSCLYTTPSLNKYQGKKISVYFVIFRLHFSVLFIILLLLSPHSLSCFILSKNDTAQVWYPAKIIPQKYDTSWEWRNESMTTCRNDTAQVWYRARMTPPENDAEEVWYNPSIIPRENVTDGVCLLREHDTAHVWYRACKNDAVQCKYMIQHENDTAQVWYRVWMVRRKYGILKNDTFYPAPYE